MVTRRIALFACVSVVLAGLSPAFGKSRRDVLATLDPDHDGTVSLEEAKKVAEATFARLDRDHEGTLSKRELRGRVSAKEFAAADADHDGSLDKAEYLNLVEQRFKAADPDNDGTLTPQELRTRAGRALLRLLV